MAQLFTFGFSACNLFRMGNVDYLFFELLLLTVFYYTVALIHDNLVYTLAGTHLWYTHYNYGSPVIRAQNTSLHLDREAMHGSRI